jgi:hypothetical protein
MSVIDLERFLDIIVPPPLDPDDELALRIFGRPSDIGVDAEPWRFGLSLGGLRRWEPRPVRSRISRMRMSRRSSHDSSR